MARTVVVSGSDRAANPRSDVGGLTSPADWPHTLQSAQSDLRHVHADSKTGRGGQRSGWRRPHVHRTRAQIAGLVLWWLVVGVLAVASVAFVIEQS